MRMLPSALAIGQDCNLCFGDATKVYRGKVTGIHFSQSKVSYDVALYLMDMGADGSYNVVCYEAMPLKGVDSIFCSPIGYPTQFHAPEHQLVIAKVSDSGHSTIEAEFLAALAELNSQTRTNDAY